MQIPIDPREAGAPANLQTTPPMFHARPPNDRTGQTQKRQTAAADAVNPAARRPGEEVCMKVDKPVDGSPAGQLVPKYQDAFL